MADGNGEEGQRQPHGAKQLPELSLFAPGDTRSNEVRGREGLGVFVRESGVCDQISITA